MNPNQETIAGYAGACSFRPRHVVNCRSTDEVCSAVVEAAASNLRVRAMGFGSSWAPHLRTPDVCLKLSGLNRIHRIDTSRKTVVVDAGTRLGDLSRALAVHNLALPSLSFFPDVTIGGAVATASHGTSLKWGTLSDFVRSMDVVLASGEVRTFGPDSSPEQLRAARVAIGTLGVIVRLELQAVDLPWVRFSELNMGLTEFLEKIPAILAQYEHVWAHWTLGEDQVRIECLEARSTPERGFHRYDAIWRPSARFVVHLLNRLGISTSLLLQIRDRVRFAIKPATYRAAPIAGDQTGQVFMSMQYGVPAHQLKEAVDKIKASSFAAQNPGRVVEFKFLAGNELSYLGPNAGGDAVLFNLWWLVEEKTKLTVFDSFEEIMTGLGARPHWGKFHHAPDVDYMRKAYPHWDEFEAVRSELDPGETFSIFDQPKLAAASRQA